jgi:hypothetical protein
MLRRISSKDCNVRGGRGVSSSYLAEEFPPRTIMSGGGGVSSSYRVILNTNYLRCLI